VNIEGDKRSPHNEGCLCPKGAATYQLIKNPNRATKVLHRKPGGTNWQEVELDWAMDRIAQLVKQTRDETFVERLEDGTLVNQTTAIFSLGGATLVLSTKENDGWFWYIPLDDDVTSVGVVGDIDRLVTNRQGTPEQILEEEIKNCPGLQGRMDGAERFAPVHVTSDFSYRASRCAGEGWVLVGDAFGFLDPMYSSGVFLALKSGELAADAISEAFETQDFSATRLGKWGETVSHGMTMIRKLVYAFYTKEFSFGRFVKTYPQYKNTIIDLLVGDVFRPEVGEVFEPMKAMAPIPEAIPLDAPKMQMQNAE